MLVGIKIGITRIGSGSRYSLLNIFPPVLSLVTSSVWTITPGSYSNPEQKGIVANYTLYKNGVATAFTPVLGGDGRLTFTDSSTDVEFIIVETVTANGAIPSSTPTNAVYVAAAPVYTNIPDTSWTATEALADADTRKTYATVSYAPAASRSFYVYRGSTPPSNNPVGVSVAAMSGSGSSWTWTSTGQASFGQVQYVRIMERDTATDTNRRWCSNVKSFVASNVPGAPVVSVTTGSGQGEINVTILNPAADNGRSLTSYQYSLDGGTWTTLAGGTAVGLHVISGTTPATTYGVRIRGVNVNGNGTATASQSATSGAVAVEPAQMVADTDWTLTDKPSATGNKLTLTVVNLPSDGGAALTDIKYTINGGSSISFGLTPGSVDITCPVAETATTVVIYAQNSVGNATGSSLTKTPTKTTSASTTAYFGADTPASTGGWKPQTVLGVEVDLVSIVSQTGMTRTWSISSGALIANGTPDVDNGKTLTVATVDGNIAVAIAAVANARSVRTDVELEAARATGLYSVPASVLLRPVEFTFRTAAGNQMFSSLSYASDRRRTFKAHPGQIKRPWMLGRNVSFSNSANLSLEDLDVFTQAGQSPKWRLFQVGSGSTGTNLYFKRISVYGPDIPPETLYDTSDWPSGFSGAAPWVFTMGGVSGNCSGCQFEDIYAKNVYTLGDFGTAGAFRMKNVRTENYYFDHIRLFGSGDLVPKFMDNVSWSGGFANANEILNPDGTTTYSPHNDGIQHADGSTYLLVIRGGKSAPRDYRNNSRVQNSTLQTNGAARQWVVFNCLFFSRGVVWGFNPGQSVKNVIANTVFARTNNGSTQIRFGAASSPFFGRGRHVIRNSYVRNLGSASIAYEAGTETNDPVILSSNRKFTNNLVTSSASLFSDNFNGPDTASYLTIENILAVMTPKVGSAADTQGVGPLDTSGAYRTMEWPPLPGDAPTLYDSGADLIIAPSPSKNALLADIPGMVMPTTWGYRYRNANGTNWTEVTGLTGATATLVAPNKTGIQVETWWVGTNGLEGPASNAQTSITALAPMTNTAAPTLTRTNGSVSLAAAGTWTPVPDSRSYTKTISGTTTSWDGVTPFVVSPGDNYYVTETAAKTGYTATSVNSAVGNYPVINVVTAPSVSISGTTVTVTAGAYDVTPDSVTKTKTIAGTTTTLSGSSFSVSADQSAYVTETPVKAGYYGAPVNSNVVTALTKITSTATGTLSRSGNTITLTPGTWSQAGVTVTRTYSVDGGAAQSLAGTTFTLNPGSSATVTETATKAGYADSDPVTTASITNPTAGTVYTETFSGLTVGTAQFTAQLDAAYGRSNSSLNTDVEADATAPGGNRIAITNASATTAYALSRDDTVTALSGTWSRFQIRAIVRIPGASDMGAIGWGSASSFYGALISRGPSANDGRIALLNNESVTTNTNGTAVASSLSAGSPYHVLIDVGSDKRTVKLKAWANSASEPTTGGVDGNGFQATYTLGADITTSTGLRFFTKTSTSGDYGMQLLWWRLAIDTDALTP